MAILETGIGGERDSTNIFPHPGATGVTTIGIDHVPALGQTVEEIAWHKAGIFKSGSVAGIVIQDDAVLKVQVNLNLRYQRSNAALAIFLAQVYLVSINPDFSMTRDLVYSLQDIDLLGKSQIIKDKDNTWFISNGHNALGLKATIS
ncbi:hypothetical protein VTL71DRAFT_9515 [Oculimacula yallundae]|uniref:Mur ligase central domain-containing protein n=1 Tax=Oculimacula yallundae TaxID=86028 RepID=A0ABR4BTV3_9HELO